MQLPSTRSPNARRVGKNYLHSTNNLILYFCRWVNTLSTEARDDLIKNRNVMGHLKYVIYVYFTQETYLVLFTLHTVVVTVD